MRELWTQRITAGAEQHFQNPLNSYYILSNGLMRNNIQLNRISLANLASFEPATFEALTKIALNFNKDESNEN